MQIKDLTGQKFGQLTVLSRNEEMSQLKKRSFFDAQCDCGNKLIVRGADLTSGVKSACPQCIKSHYNKDDLTGKKFGRLTVIKDSGLRTHRQIIYDCQCECGNTCQVASTLLRSGKTQSCGCLKESVGELNIAKILDQNDIQYIQQYKFQDLSNMLRFDFAVFKDNMLDYLIEFDGVQHYDTTSGWFTENLITNDKLKNEYCLNHQYRLIRIPYSKRDTVTMEDLVSDKYVVTKINHYEL